jgi:hypothetical protein
MSNDIESYRDYWQYVQRSAVIELEETEEYVADWDKDIETDHLADCAAEFSADQDRLAIYSPRTIIYHTDNGFDGEGYERYVAHQEFESGRSMIFALGRAAFYNDVREAMEGIIEARNDLGDAMTLLNESIFSEGIICHYTYVRDTPQETYEYEFTFRSLGEGEWKMFDHNDEAFEVISPDVHFEQSDDESREKNLKLWLDNICAKRLREVGY